MLAFAEERPGRNSQLSRRTVLSVGALAFGSLSLPDWLRMQSRADAESRVPRDTAIIHVVTGGGLSHIDTFDPKPDAPAEIRGEFGTIATSAPSGRSTRQACCRTDTRVSLSTCSRILSAKMRSTDSSGSVAR